VRALTNVRVLGNGMERKTGQGGRHDLIQERGKGNARSGTGLDDTGKGLQLPFQDVEREEDREKKVKHVRPAGEVACGI